MDEDFYNCLYKKPSREYISQTDHYLQHSDKLRCVTTHVLGDLPRFYKIWTVNEDYLKVIWNRMKKPVPSESSCRNLVSGAGIDFWTETVV